MGEVRERMGDNLQMSGSVQKTEFPRNSSHIWKGILAALFTLLIGEVLLQGIFPTQGSNSHLLHWQADSLLLSHREALTP